MDPITFARIALLSAVLAISSPNVVPLTPAAGFTIYAVQAGDTLSSIARQFDTTADKLAQTNGLSAENPLMPGQQLQVPEKTAAAPTVTPLAGSQTYTVQAGDTLGQIAARFGATVEDLVRANGLKSADTLEIGQVLVIPGKASSVPEGIALAPSVVKQGNTVEFKITASTAVTATGTFAGTPLQFLASGGNLFALSGISRCAKTGPYAARITYTTAGGDSQTLNFNVQVSATNYPVQDITLTPQMAALLDPAIERAENARVANTVAPLTGGPLWSGPFRSPLAIKNPLISAVFGQRRSYNGGAPGLCGHEGQDFAVDGGTPVFAPAGGVVALAEPLKVRGNVVFINHGFGVFSGFYHLSKIEAKNGQVVAPGDEIARVGTTGFSTGDHLHWSLWVDGVYVDPIEWENRTIP